MREHESEEDLSSLRRRFSAVRSDAEDLVRLSSDGDPRSLVLDRLGEKLLAYLDEFGWELGVM
jgi:hypothetical protein